MTSLLLALFFSQIVFEESSPIALDAPTFTFETVATLPDGLMVCDQNASIVRIFDQKGKPSGQLKHDDLQLPTNASWLADRLEYYVYDAAHRNFYVFNKSKTFVRRIETTLPMFFQVGSLYPTSEGIVATTSLSEDGKLLALFDQDFEIEKYNYDILGASLQEMSPVLYRAFACRSDMYGGERILAIQTLSREIVVFDAKLSSKDSMELQAPGWKEPKYGRLKKVSKNPRELEKYQPSYSEVVDLQSLAGSLFVVGYRNIFGENAYFFQCYDLSTFSPVGSTYKTTKRPVGSGYSRIYLKAPGGGMTLQPIIIH